MAYPIGSREPSVIVTILVAEDSATMRKVVEMSFAGEAARVILFERGGDLIRHALAEPPDVVIVDAGLEGMNGYEVAASLREDAQTSRVPVILLTHELTPPDQGRCAELGIAGHIDKPFESMRLIALVGDVLQRKALPASVQRGPRITSPISETEPPPAPGPGQESRSAETAAKASKGSAEESPPPFPSSPPPLPDGLVGAVEMIASVLPPGKSAVLSQEIYARMSEFGLSAEQLTAVVAVAYEVVEKVVWEVVPELAETIIREEIKRLTSE